MEISPTTPTPAPTPAATEAKDRPSAAISSDFDTFLKMLTVQMKNQDPLEPIKSEDFAAQLATFSGVEQQVLTNERLDDLTSQMNLMGMSQLAGWVGMEAMAPVTGVFDGSPITLMPKPELTADRAELVVTNASGAEVQRVQIPVSQSPLEWTGALGAGVAPYGAYDFAVESFSGSASIGSAPVDIYTRVTEARTDGGQTMLVTQSGAEVPASSILGLRNPPGSA